MDEAEDDGWSSGLRRGYELEGGDFCEAVPIQSARGETGSVQILDRRYSASRLTEPGAFWRDMGGYLFLKFFCHTSFSHGAGRGWKSSGLGKRAKCREL